MPGIGLGFFRIRTWEAISRSSTDGILPGFDSQIFLAPDDGVGVMAFANGARRGMHWLHSLRLGACSRRLLGVPD